MSDNATTDTTESSDAAPSAQQGDQQHVQFQGAATEQEESSSTWSVENYQEEISKLRKENGDRRVANRELNSQLKDATEKLAEADQLRDEHEVTLSTNAQLEERVLRLEAALDAGIAPEHARDFADRLKGSSEEDLREDAKQLSTLFPRAGHTNGKKQPDPSQGAMPERNLSPLGGWIAAQTGRRSG